MGWGFWIFLWIVFGFVGGFLGSTVNKGGTGFLLGILLGPIGWVIVFLIPEPRDKKSDDAIRLEMANEWNGSKKSEVNPPSAPRSNPPERDLTSDAYKIWLTKEYKISKNELFEKYECFEKLFDTLELALEYADVLEAGKRGEKVRPKGDQLGDWRKQLEESKNKLDL